MEILIPNEEALPQAASRFLQAIPKDVRLIDFSGPMGAGKTTFIAALCKVLGASDDPSSPTFSLVNEYAVTGRTGADAVIYHFDFYRLDSPEEALEIGVDDYFYSGSYCFMEWAGNVEAVIPAETLRVSLSINPDGSRLIRWNQ